MNAIFEFFSANSKGLNPLLLIGIAVFLGTVGAGIFRKLRTPQVVGYIVVGVVLGPVLHIVSAETIKSFELFNLFALGVIGFLVGGELKREIFVKFGRQVPTILIFEGVTAFVVVGVLSFLVMLCFSDWHTALAVGVVFGAICAATDPASTVAVLWEYKARGPLTAMLTAIVTLDDALALVLYAFGVGVAGVVTGHQEAGLAAALFDASYEMLGSLVIGVMAGLVLSWILGRTDGPERVLAFTIGIALVVIGLAISLKLDVIISSMALGVTLINTNPRRVQSSFEIVHRFCTPIYILFFVLVGARLEITGVNLMILSLAATYVVGSITGKTVGSYWGAVHSGAVKSVRKYLGFCLYPQGGIAVGLLIMASQKFESDISSIMLLVVIIGAFVLQLIGPIGVKWGAKKAGELGLNITEADLISGYKVGDIMDTEAPVIEAGTALSEVIRVVSDTSKFYYPVIDSEKRLLGGITLDGIRNTFTTQELNEWLVALDIVEPIIARVEPELALSEALEKARRLNVEHIPVTGSGEAKDFVGVLDVRTVRRRLSTELLSKQRQADKLYIAGAG